MKRVRLALVLFSILLTVSCFASPEPPPAPPIPKPRLEVPSSAFVLAQHCGDMNVTKMLVEEPSSSEVQALNSATTDGMIADNIRTLTMGRNVLWIGFAEGYTQASSVAVYDGSSVEACGNEQDVIPRGHINKISVEDEDRVWVGTDGNGLFLFDGFWRNYTKAEGLPDNRIYDLDLYPQGAIFATWEGIVGYEDWSGELTLPDWVDPMIARQHIHAFLEHGNSMWMGTVARGIIEAKFTPEGVMEWTTYTTEEGTLPSNNVRDLEVAPNRVEIWAAMDGGLAIYNPKTNSWTAQEPPNPEVMAVDFDYDGMPWIATKGGVFYQRDSEWHAYYTDFPTNDLAFNDSGFILIATEGNGLVIGKIPRTE